MFIGYLPNLELRFALMSRLRVPHFSPIGARIRVLWRILQSVRKEVEEKNEEKEPKLWRLVSRKWLERFSSNLECALPYLAGTTAATLVLIGYGITELQRCENRIYFLPVKVCIIPRNGTERNGIFRSIILRNGTCYCSYVRKMIILNLQINMIV